MVNVKVTVNTRPIDKFIRLTRSAAVSSVERIDDFLLKKAQEFAPKFERVLELSGRRQPVVLNPATNIAQGGVSFDAGYALYVELGFTGHFVPFHIAPSLYRQALVQWGWRVPNPDKLRNLKPGRVYLIPRGKDSPVWGVFVRGDAQPFMKPAVRALVDSKTHIRIVEEEFDRHYRELNS